jgi:hypothetical protein
VLCDTKMPDKSSFLNASVSILEENPDYSWLRRVSPESVKSLHKLCDEVHQSLLGGPLFEFQKSDWKRAIEIEEIDQIYLQYAERSERVGMLTVLTSEGILRHCEVLLGLVHATVHNREKRSFLTRLFNTSGELEKSSRRVGFAFLELVDTRFRNSQSLPWDPDFPLEILNGL